MGGAQTYVDEGKEINVNIFHFVPMPFHEFYLKMVINLVIRLIMSTFRFQDNFE